MAPKGGTLRSSLALCFIDVPGIRTRATNLGMFGLGTSVRDVHHSISLGFVEQSSPNWSTICDDRAQNDFRTKTHPHQHVQPNPFNLDCVHTRVVGVAECIDPDRYRMVHIANAFSQPEHPKLGNSLANSRNINKTQGKRRS